MQLCRRFQQATHQWPIPNRTPSPRPLSAVPSARPGYRTICRFLSREAAAAASEYAAIFAVIVIALMVCINIVGKHVGRAVRSADAKLAGDYLLADAPAGGGNRNPEQSERKKDSPAKKNGACVRPAGSQQHDPLGNFPKPEMGAGLNSTAGGIHNMGRDPKLNRSRGGGGDE